MSGTTWFIREYECANGITDKTKFPAPWEERPCRPGSRQYERGVRRAEKGATEAKHELARELNNNFRAGVDHMLTPTYDAAGWDRLVMRAGSPDAPDAVWVAADREIHNWVKRVQNACKKAGVVFRYAFVTSDLDGKTLDPVRVHHHVVLNAEAAEIAKAKWTAGDARLTLLRGGKHGDLSPVAEYMIRQARQVVPGRARYSPSRNLVKPKPSRLRRVRNPEAELRVPKGCELIYRSEGVPGRPQLLRYHRPPKEGPEDGEDA